MNSAVWSSVCEWGCLRRRADGFLSSGEDAVFQSVLVVADVSVPLSRGKDKFFLSYAASTGHRCAHRGCFLLHLCKILLWPAGGRPLFFCFELLSRSWLCWSNLQCLIRRDLDSFSLNSHMPSSYLNIKCTVGRGQKRAFSECCSLCGSLLGSAGFPWRCHGEQTLSEEH